MSHPLQPQTSPMRSPLVPLFPGRATSVPRGDNCSPDSAPALLHCPSLCLLQHLALLPLHICSVLPAARLRTTSAFWLWAGFLHWSAPEEGPGWGCWPRSSVLQSHGAGAHPCWLPSTQEPLRSSLPSAPLPGARCQHSSLCQGAAHPRAVGLCCPRAELHGDAPPCPVLP